MEPPVLHHMNKRLHAEQTFERAIRRILDDAMALNGAEYGTLQLPWGGHLLIVDQRNFKRPFLEIFRKVAREHGSACGRALRLGETVIIEDTEVDEEFRPFPARREPSRLSERGHDSTPGTEKGFDRSGGDAFRESASPDGHRNSDF